ncbi:peptidoglycan recognition family protein [Paenibacillus sp. JX-17]|uniref:N-acetylmuramoyl-L-alanine amidase n=1 Tax=Paenibacillus lacisoli TaxID=3064525 RepID=A0ABT9CKI6_9BACL|nr:peptidoglycan recognition family protein [Paenibacillus sp. JX-17]MDO7908412.1 peptidoglycan recognition family protein [Paenibacillus sp. JX-17]
MIFNPNKYTIERRYIDKRHNVRPGTRLTSGTPGFFVAHDTGNPGATAENHFNYFQRLKDRAASAQTFIDDKVILEIIPTGTGPDPAEKAWHVLYSVTTDNDRFGDDANDIALGVELCYGGKINFTEAYNRFVWYMAYCCWRWGKNPLTHIPTHKQLDPARKRDCDQALTFGGKGLKQFLYDVAAELNGEAVPHIPESDKLPENVSNALIKDYVQPAWAAAHAAKAAQEKAHFHNLADNLRKAAGILLQGQTKAGVLERLPKSNAQEIIFRWLKPAWQKAHEAGDATGKKHYNNLANYLRRSAGIPEE